MESTNASACVACTWGRSGAEPELGEVLGCVAGLLGCEVPLEVPL